MAPLVDRTDQANSGRQGIEARRPKRRAKVSSHHEAYASERWARLSPCSKQATEVLAWFKGAERQDVRIGEAMLAADRVNLRLDLRRVRRVITGSRFSKSRIVHLIGVPDDHVLVVPYGVDAGFRPQVFEER